MTDMSSNHVDNFLADGTMSQAAIDFALGRNTAGAREVVREVQAAAQGRTTDEAARERMLAKRAARKAAE